MGVGVGFGGQKGGRQRGRGMQSGAGAQWGGGVGGGVSCCMCLMWLSRGGGIVISVFGTRSSSSVEVRRLGLRLEGLGIGGKGAMGFWWQL